MATTTARTYEEACAAHEWQYDVTTGKNEFDHAIQLKTFEVKVEGGEVKVAI